jgi:tetratricopeptide (TPR) repeat protein
MRRLAGSLLLVTILAQAADPVRAASGQIPPLYAPDVAEYLSLVSAYRRDSSGGAVASVRTWDGPRLERTVRELPNQLGGRIRVCDDVPGAVTFTTLDAAVLLHTDAALAALREADADEGSLHLDQAQKLLEWTFGRRTRLPNAEQETEAARCAAPPPIAIRDWYLVAARLTLAEWALFVSERLADRLVQAAPGDPDALFAAGNVQEGLATNDAQYHLPPPAWRFSSNESWVRAQTWYQQSLRDRKRYREAASQFYARALKSAPDRDDIRLRHGWVLLQLDRREEAQRALEAVVRSTGARATRYLAWLFLGRVHEMSNRLSDAAECYRRAADAEPDAHVARLALSHALGRQDLLDDSRRAALRALVPPGLSAERDPWTEYPHGDWRAAEALLDRLRDRVRERTGGAR